MTEQETPTGPPWWRRHWLTLAVVVVLLAGGLGTAFVLTRSDDSKPGLVDVQALIVARQEATYFFSLDYRQAEADVDRVIGLATGQFKDEYVANKATLISELKSKKLVTTGSIPDGGAAIELAGKDQVYVLVVVDLARTANGKTDNVRNRVRIVLTKVDGRWLVSAVNQVG